VRKRLRDFPALHDGTCGLLQRDLGGTFGFGAWALRPGNELASTLVPLTTVFQSGLGFYGGRYYYALVHGIGVFAFSSRTPTSTPEPFPASQGPMIAPWWAHADLRVNGRPGESGVYVGERPGRFVATWYNVGFWALHFNRLNTFQLVLRDRSDVGAGDFDVELRYYKCAWTTGDDGGGTDGYGGRAAQAGFDSGNGRDYLALPGAGTAAVLDLCRTTNVAGAPMGFWQYLVRGGHVSSP